MRITTGRKKNNLSPVEESLSLYVSFANRIASGDAIERISSRSVRSPVVFSLFPRSLSFCALMQHRAASCFAINPLFKEDSLDGTVCNERSSRFVYVFFFVVSGEKMTLLNSQHSCYLRQNRQVEILILIPFGMRLCSESFIDRSIPRRNGSVTCVRNITLIPHVINNRSRFGNTI